jgi:hypothetical protein
MDEPAALCSDASCARLNSNLLFPTDAAAVVGEEAEAESESAAQSQSVICWQHSRRGGGGGRAWGHFERGPIYLQQPQK